MRLARKLAAACAAVVRDPGGAGGAGPAGRAREGGVRRGRGGALRGPRAGLRAPGVSEQDRARDAADADVKPPRELTPAFFGCYDWHSSVHGHWLLARLARTVPRRALRAARPRRRWRAASRRRTSPSRRAIWPGPAARASSGPTAWRGCCSSLPSCGSGTTRRRGSGPRRCARSKTAAAARLREWLPKLSRPIRIGEHDQTAFAFGLVLDWARTAGDQPMIDLIVVEDRRSSTATTAAARCTTSRPARTSCRRASPRPTSCAACSRRRRMPTGCGRSCRRFPPTGQPRWLEPVVVTDPTDPKLAHLDGLNLSRAWMLDGIVSGLPAERSRAAPRCRPPPTGTGRPA